MTALLLLFAIPLSLIRAWLVWLAWRWWMVDLGLPELPYGHTYAAILIASLLQAPQVPDPDGDARVQLVAAFAAFTSQLMVAGVTIWVAGLVIS